MHRCRHWQLDVISGKELAWHSPPCVKSLAGLTATAHLKSVDSALASTQGSAPVSADLTSCDTIAQACRACCPVTLQPWQSAR